MSFSGSILNKSIILVIRWTFSSFYYQTDRKLEYKGILIIWKHIPSTNISFGLRSEEDYTCLFVFYTQMMLVI